MEVSVVLLWIWTGDGLIGSFQGCYSRWDSQDLLDLKLKKLKETYGDLDEYWTPRDWDIMPKDDGERLDHSYFLEIRQISLIG